MNVEDLEAGNDTKLPGTVPESLKPDETEKKTEFNDDIIKAKSCDKKEEEEKIELNWFLKIAFQLILNLELWQKIAEAGFLTIVVFFVLEYKDLSYLRVIPNDLAGCHSIERPLSYLELNTKTMQQCKVILENPLIPQSILQVVDDLYEPPDLETLTNDTVIDVSAVTMRNLTNVMQQNQLEAYADYLLPRPFCRCVSATYEVEDVVCYWGIKKFLYLLSGFTALMLVYVPKKPSYKTFLIVGIITTAFFGGTFMWIWNDTLNHPYCYSESTEWFGLCMGWADEKDVGDIMGNCTTTANIIGGFLSICAAVYVVSHFFLILGLVFNGMEKRRRLYAGSILTGATEYELTKVF